MITYKRLRACLRYEPRTGLFWWAQAGLARQRHKPAGTVRKDGYAMICIGGRCYYAHRLAWLFMMGRWPLKEIDHKDGNPSNNRWSNLREADRVRQLQNSRIRRNNTSGHKGVCWATKEKRWMASAKFNGKNRFLGYYSTKTAAAAVYSAFAKKHFGEFARVR